jgi:pimeloyl-ACP methyl ester carboxylesterase
MSKMEIPMMRLVVIGLLAGASVLGASAPALAQEKTVPAAAAQAAKSGRVEVNGVNYYYEIHGTGEPLLLLHGGLGSIDMFRPMLPKLADHRQVIAVDLQGHGRTPLGRAAINPVDIGNDMGALLTRLGYKQVDVFGYSFGGTTALQLAIQHPAQVRRLALMSAGFAQNGFYPEMLPQQAAVGAAMADAMKETPMYRSYVSVAPNPAEFPKLLDAMGAMMRKPYDWSAGVKALKMPVLLVYGDSDMYRPEHIVQFYQLLGGGLRDAGWGREKMSPNRLAIIPDATHYDIFLSPTVPNTVLPFLDGKSGAASWADQVAGK